MFEIIEKFEFTSSHKIILGDGTEGNLHGHEWHLEISAIFDVLDDHGISFYFNDFRNKTQSIVDEFDHAYLNKHPFFKDVVPTAENVAKIIFQKLSELVNTEHIHVRKVEIWTESRRRIKYYEGGM